MQAINKYTKRVMQPTEIYLNFEKALSNVFTNIFSSTTVTCDLFHFIQANVRKIDKLGYGSKVIDLVKDLNMLWEKPDKKEFNAYLVGFLDR
jgi:hypothetical protein